MNFAPSKCYIMSIALKHQPSSFSYVLCNTPPEGVTFQKYLAVYITNFLNNNWTKQAVEVKKKANKILGGLQRNLTSCNAVVNERAYLSLVRPVCEYGSATRSPHTQKDILSVLNPFSVVRHVLFVTITVVPVALIQCYRTWVGKILRHVGRSSI